MGAGNSGRCNDLIMSWRGSRGVKRVDVQEGVFDLSRCCGKEGRRKVGALNGFNGIYEWITKLGRLFPPRVCTWLAARGCTEGGHALGQRTAQTLL